MICATGSRVLRDDVDHVSKRQHGLYVCQILRRIIKRIILHKCNILLYVVRHMFRNVILMAPICPNERSGRPAIHRNRNLVLYACAAIKIIALSGTDWFRAQSYLHLPLTF